jgi:hypothetical protein
MLDNVHQQKVLGVLGGGELSGSHVLVLEKNAHSARTNMDAFLPGRGVLVMQYRMPIHEEFRSAFVILFGVAIGVSCYRPAHVGSPGSSSRHGAQRAASQVTRAAAVAHV